MERAYVSEHVRKILESKEGISLLTQIIENQSLEVRVTNGLVDPIYIL